MYTHDIIGFTIPIVVGTILGLITMYLTCIFCEYLDITKAKKNQLSNLEVFFRIFGGFILATIFGLLLLKFCLVLRSTYYLIVGCYEGLPPDILARRLALVRSMLRQGFAGLAMLVSIFFSFILKTRIRKFTVFNATMFSSWCMLILVSAAHLLQIVYLLQALK